MKQVKRKYEKRFVCETILTGFIIVIFCLSAWQSVSLIVEERALIEADVRLDLSLPLERMESKRDLLRLDGDRDFLFLSIISMVFSGLGLVFVLLFKLKKLKKTNIEKQKMMSLLEPRVAAVESSTDGIAITNGEGELRYVNPALAVYHGYERSEDLVGEHWQVLYSSTQQEWLKAEVFPVLKEEKYWQGYCMGLRKDGNEYHQHISVTMVEDGGVVLVVRDYTDLMESISLSNRRLAAIEAAQDGMALADRDGNLSYINLAFRELCDVAAIESYSDPVNFWEQIGEIAGKDDLSVKALPVLREKGHWSGVTPMSRHGKIVHSEIYITRLIDGGLVGTLRDITDRVRAAEEKDELQKQFYQAQKMEAIGRLAGGIAHDFNNILASILGYAEFLLEDLDDQSKQHNFASQIMRGSVQARQLVEQILAFSRQKESAREVVDLTRAVHETAMMLKATLPATIALELWVDVSEALIDANATQISQTVMNLCVNARDAIEDEHGVVKVGIGVIKSDKTPFSDELLADLPSREDTPPVRIVDQDDGGSVLLFGGVARDKDYVFLEVSDTGCGIPREVMEHIFEPFFTTKDIDKGTGLGLSTVHGMMTGHQGAVMVTSVPGHGTTFNLYFPLAEGASVSAAEDFYDEKWKGTGNILVVEDQEHVREMLIQMLIRLGYDAQGCSAADEAIDHLRENQEKYDLVLSDYMMPRMTGAEMAMEIKEDIPYLPVVLLSGHSRKKLSQVMKEAPAVRAVLRKPIDSHTLSKSIFAILNGERNVA